MKCTVVEYAIRYFVRCILIFTVYMIYMHVERVDLSKVRARKEDKGFACDYAPKRGTGPRTLRIQMASTMLIMMTAITILPIWSRRWRRVGIISGIRYAVFGVGADDTVERRTTGRERGA